MPRVLRVLKVKIQIMQITEEISINNKLTDLYNFNSEKLMHGLSPYINTKREEAIALFQKLGLPTKKNEEYRYIDIEKIFSEKYTYSFAPKKLQVDFSSLFQCNVPKLDAHLLLFVNGWFYSSNQKDNLPKGIVLGSFAKLCTEYPELIEKYYSKIAKPEKNGLAALNTAFAQDGLFMYLTKNTIVEKPIQIINILVEDEDCMVQQRNLIIAEENSQAKIVVCNHTLTPFRYLSNSITEVQLEENARLDIFNIQDENNSSANINSIYVNQAKSSNFVSNIASIHGGTIRNNIYATLDGEGSETNIYGIYLNDMKQHIDNYTFIDHAKPNCKSTQLYKGILDHEATGAFNGKILVREDSQNTIAFQANNNLLLSDNARMITKPQLEIYADDVKCSHGATVGQIDEEAMFYMRARGISHKEARLMLMYAFANEVIEKINVEALRERISDLVEKRLRGELARCSNCVINCE